MYKQIKLLFDIKLSDRYDDVLKIFNISDSIQKYYLNSISDRDYTNSLNPRNEIKTNINIQKQLIPILKEINIDFTEEDLSKFWKKYLNNFFILKSKLGSLFDILYIALHNQKFNINHPSSIREIITKQIKEEKDWKKILKNYLCI